jgi:spore germination protein KC
MIANPRDLASSEGGGGSEGDPTKGTASPVITVESPSIYAAMNMVNTFVGRRMSLMHAKGIIFSEAMAKDGTMAKFIPTLTQFRETRGTAFLAVSKGSPEALLEKMKPLLEANPAKYIELMAATSIYTGFIPAMQLQEFYNESKVEGISPISILFATDKDVLPQNDKGQYRREGAYVAGGMLKKGGAALQAMGAAVFSEGKMVGKLTGDETAIHAMFRGKYDVGVFSMKDPLAPGNTLSMTVFAAGPPEIKVRLTSEGPVIDAKIGLEGNLLGATSTIDYALPEHRRALEQAFERNIQRQAMALVERSQQEFKVDLLGFGTKARRLVWTEDQWRQLNWRDHYPDATVQVAVDYKIRRTGNLLRTLPIVKPDQGIEEGSNPQ